MTIKLSSDSFVALAAVAWADGRMSPREAEGLLVAARAHGLDGSALAAVERATKERVSITSFDATKLSSWERIVTFGLASWLCRLDGLQQDTETEALKQLAQKLRSEEASDFKLRSAAAAAYDVAMQPAGHRPERFDFAALEAKLREKFPTVK